MSPTPAAPANRWLSRPRIAALVCALVLGSLAPSLYAQVRIAVVDMQRAIVETNQGRIAKNQLKTLFEKRQIELDARSGALRHMRDQIEHDRPNIDEATLRRRMDDYQRQFVDLQQAYLDYQQELSRQEAELTKQIYANLKEVVRAIGQQQGFTAIFEQDSVLWNPQNLDLTDVVIQTYNQLYPADASAPAADVDAAVPSASAHDAARPAVPATRPRTH